MSQAEVSRAALKQSIAYCGLICRLCFLACKCDGCRSANPHCERDSSDQGCFQRDCCVKRGFEGCWECGNLSGCMQGIYSLGEYSKVKGFAVCIQEDGVDSFVTCVLNNEANGLSVEKGKDYDGKSIPEVLRLLSAGYE